MQLYFHFRFYTFLSIDESFYSSERKGTAHRCYKSLGSVETWMEKGLADPITHFQLEVDALNQEKAVVTINQDAIDKDLLFAGYNLLVTSETKMKDQDIYDTYHNLWRIEESFKIMKSDLDARPVFCQKEETIKGHFLICYLTVLLERLFQFKVLENKYATTEIFRFLKNFRVTKAETKYINTATTSDIINELSLKLKLPLTNYFLTETQIRSILNCKI